MLQNNDNDIAILTAIFAALEDILASPNIFNSSHEPELRNIFNVINNLSTLATEELKVTEDSILQLNKGLNATRSYLT